MPLLAKDSQESTFEPIPAGVLHAVCYGVIDLGTQPSTNPTFPARRKVAITWEIPAERITIKGASLPRAITDTWTLSLASKGKLRPMLESWRGRAFTEIELEGFDVENLIGVNGLINVVHTRKGDKTFANVASVSPLVKSMVKLQLESKPLFFALGQNPQESDIPLEMPAWLKAKIMQSKEFLGDKDPQHQGNQPSEEEMANQTGGDQDVPF